jgi:hypothetical protein
MATMVTIESRSIVIPTANSETCHEQGVCKSIQTRRGTSLRLGQFFANRIVNIMIRTKHDARQRIRSPDTLELH